MPKTSWSRDVLNKMDGRCADGGEFACEGEVARASGGNGTDGSSWWGSGGDGEYDDDDRERCEPCDLRSDW